MCSLFIIRTNLRVSTTIIPVLYKVTEAQRLSNLPKITQLVTARGRTGTQVVQAQTLVLLTTWLCTYINLFNPCSHPIKKVIAPFHRCLGKL